MFSIRGLIPLALIVFLLGVFIFMSLHIKLLKVERDRARSELKSLSIKVNEQNKAIDQWKKESSLYEKRFRIAEKKARVVVQKYDSRIAKIDKEKVSLSCDDSVKWAIKKSGEI